MKSARRPKIGDAAIVKHGDGSHGKIASSVRNSGLKEFARKFAVCDDFISQIQDWLQDKLENPENQFREPFQIDELRQLDFALEGVIFQQFLRMPPSSSSSVAAAAAAAGEATGNVDADTYIAVEDFVHTTAQTLWETLWSSEDRMPFFVTGPRGGASKSKRHSLQGVALVGKYGRGMNTVWEHVAEFVEVENEIGASHGLANTIGRAIFHALHMLMSRLYSEKKPSVRKHTDTAYVVFVDSRYGGVVRLKGDVSRMEIPKPAAGGLPPSCYQIAADWVGNLADVRVSSVEPVWNRFGNANWGDVGALQLILATLHCIEQCRGSPRRSIAELAAEHGARLQRRKIERRLLEIQENGGGSVGHSVHPQQHSVQYAVQHQQQQQQQQQQQHEIEEEGEEEEAVEEIMMTMKLEAGTVLWLEDAQWQRGFQITGILREEKCAVYTAIAVDTDDSKQKNSHSHSHSNSNNHSNSHSSSSSGNSTSSSSSKVVAVYVGAHPSQLEPSWEEMTTWYQVQRQTRVLNIMKQRGISSKYLPQLVASGRLLHPGSCSRQSPGGRCDHPACGIGVLVTCPVGEPLDAVVATGGWLSSDEALRCCHDILSALRSASSAGIQHGDISPKSVTRVKSAAVDRDEGYYYVLCEWGRAVLEDRDSPALSPRYSSTYALQEGKLCPAADAESLVYLLFYLVGGTMPEFESLEAALQWRERAWAIRTFQIPLGDVSTLLKAFADYIDSLIGTPYPPDYDIWLRRLNRAIHSSSSSSDSGKRIQYIEAGGGGGGGSSSGGGKALDYMGESSGTSGT